MSFNEKKENENKRKKSYNEKLKDLSKNNWKEKRNK